MRCAPISTALLPRRLTNPGFAHPSPKLVVQPRLGNICPTIHCLSLLSKRASSTSFGWSRRLIWINLIQPSLRPDSAVQCSCQSEQSSQLRALSSRSWDGGAVIVAPRISHNRARAILPAARPCQSLPGKSRRKTCRFISMGSGRSRRSTR